MTVSVALPAHRNVTICDLEDNWTGVPKPPLIITSTEDFLALSCAWHRLRLNPGDSDICDVANLQDPRLREFVTPEDNELATAIRDYYSKKITWQTLQGRPLSYFKTDLITYLNGVPYQATDRDMPMLFRMPEFYLYDLKIDILRETTTPPGTKGTTYSIDINNLYPKQSIMRKSRAKKFTEYWFTNRDNVLFKIDIQNDNPLKHIWERMFVKGDQFTISGWPLVAKRFDIPHLYYPKWELAQTE